MVKYIYIGQVSFLFNHKGWKFQKYVRIFEHRTNKLSVSKINAMSWKSHLKLQIN